MSVAMADEVATRPVEQSRVPRGDRRAERGEGWLDLAAILYLVFMTTLGLSAGDLLRNEGLRALIAREMLRSGDWLTPTLHGEPHLTKPPGMYAAIALASAPLGRVSVVSARAPSIVAAVAAALLFFWTFRRCVDRRAGRLALVILPTSLLWLDRVPSAEIDMLQLAWVSASLLAALRALELAEEGNSGFEHWLWWQVALFCVACGWLTKWTAPAFFYAALVPLLLLRGQSRLLWQKPHLTALALASALGLGWIAAVAVRVGPDLLIETIRREALLRLSPSHHPRPYPWMELITFPGSFLAACLPWAAVAVISLRRDFVAIWDERGRRLIQLLHCWLWPSLLLWTILPGHRPRHCLPLQPAIAGLATLVCVAWLDGRLRWTIRRWTPRTALLAVFAVALGVKLVHVQAIVASRSAVADRAGKAARIADFVPADAPLHVCRLKDESLLFHVARATRRFAEPAELPGRTAAYCLLTREEWQHWPADRPAVALLQSTDGQGEPIVLIQVP